MARRGTIENLKPFKPEGEVALARKAIGVKFPPELDAWVRSLPNRSEWIREAVREKYERETAADTAQDREEAS